MERLNNSLFSYINFKIIICLSLIVLSSYALANDTRPHELNQVLERNKQTVLNFYDLATNGRDPKRAVELFVGEHYKQHNPDASNDKQGFIDILGSIGKNNKDWVSTFHRVIAEENLVIVHAHHQITWKPHDTGLGSLDIFLLDDNGKIIEHWDAMRVRPRMTKSGNSVYDGQTQVKDYEMTKANKKLVEEYTSNVLISENYTEIFTYYDGDSLIQHNPDMNNGVLGLLDGMRELVEKGTPIIYKELVEVVAEGNFVFTFSAGWYGGIEERMPIMDLYRIDDGKIAEHWDVLWQKYRLPKQPAHDNGYF